MAAAVRPVAVRTGVLPSRAEMPFAVGVAAETSRGVAGAGMAAGSPAAPDFVSPDPVDTVILSAEGAEAAPKLKESSSAPRVTRTATVTAITASRAAAAT